MSGTRRGAREGGESLVELLVSVAILGVTIVAIIEVMFTMVGSTTVLSDDVKAQNALASWAGAVTHATYTDCADADQVSAASPAQVPTGFTANVDSVTYWNGSAFVTPCPATDTGLQLITLSVTAPPGPMPVTPQQLKVVKRKPCGSSC